MKILADTTRCEGHGMCESVAPEVYELDDDAVVRLRFDRVPAEFEAQAEAGVHSCPVAALHIAT